jgi:site-specific recombinase XerD
VGIHEQRRALSSARLRRKGIYDAGKRGFRDETRAEYRALLDKYALSYSRRSVLLVDAGPRQIAEFIGWLLKQPNGRGGVLSDKSVRNALGPLRAVLPTAKHKGVVRDNPAVGAALPHRPRIEEDEDLPQPLPGDSMDLVVSLVHPDHRVMFDLLAATGVRRSKLLAFHVRQKRLTGIAAR